MKGRFGEFGGQFIPKTEWVGRVHDTHYALGSLM
jgi:tryptophan synthase beta subunit